MPANSRWDLIRRLRVKEINCRALRYNQMDLLKVNIRNRITADEMVSAIESAVTWTSA